MPEKVVQVLSAHRITLPSGWREKYGIEEGDHVKCVWDGEAPMTVVPLEIKEKQTDDV